MCGGRYVGGRGGNYFLGRNVEEMGSSARISAAFSVLVPVVLSGVFLVVFVPQLWWVFTTYFWVAFPAVSEAEVARELLEAIRDGGEVSAASVAARTSLSVAEADRRLRELAENGHIEVLARGGAVLYALWGTGGEAEA